MSYDSFVHAVKQGNLEEVKALLRDNPDLVFCKDNDAWGPLHWAAASGHKDVAELLLANGADVNAKDSNGWTPLHFAAAYGYKDLAELLRRRGGHE
jgi:ankyrin repeat protein